MTAAAANAFARALRPDAPPAHVPPAVLTTATVTALAPFTILYHGTSVAGVPHLAAYTPALNHVVWVLSQGTSLLVLGNSV